MKAVENRDQYYFPIGSIIRCLDPHFDSGGRYRLEKWVRCDILGALHNIPCSDCLTQGMIMKLRPITEEAHGLTDSDTMCLLEDIRAEDAAHAKVLWEIVND